MTLGNQFSRGGYDERAIAELILVRVEVDLVMGFGINGVRGIGLGRLWVVAGCLFRSDFDQKIKM